MAGSDKDGVDLAPTASLDPISPERFGYAEARHLLWRAGFGGTPEQIRLLAEWGPERSVDHMLGFSDEPWNPPRADAFDADIMKPLSREERQRYRQALSSQREDVVEMFRRERQRRQREDRRQIAQLQRWWLERMIESPRPAEEKLTLFWHGHFATSYRTIENSYHLYMQNQLFRVHAAGSFADLLRAIIRDPAMLGYLDNDQNRRGSPNENLARELMELFALGEGRYSERDIREGARALTGYTYEHNEFRFIPSRHDAGGKTILGRRGGLDGDGFVDAILAQRACAEFIAYKLHRFMVGADASGATPARAEATRRVVRRLAATLRGDRYRLRPMLRDLLLSEHFYDPLVMRAKIKSPAELVVGAVRSLRTPVRDLGVLADALDLMGQDLFFPPNVAGWAGGRSWINTSTLFVRQNILTFLLTGKTPTGFDPLAEIERYDPAVLLAELERAAPGRSREPEAVVDFLLRLTLGGEPRAQDRERLRGFIERHGGAPTPTVLLGVLALVTAMPEYQVC